MSFALPLSIPAYADNYQYYAHSVFVVCLGDVSESLLACCVPELEFGLLAIHIENLDLEVDPDGGHMCRFIILVGEAKEDIRLPH